MHIWHPLWVSFGRPRVKVLGKDSVRRILDDSMEPHLTSISTVSGEGFFVSQITGQGIFWAQSMGAIIQRTLADGEEWIGNCATPALVPSLITDEFNHSR